MDSVEHSLKHGLDGLWLGSPKVDIADGDFKVLEGDAGVWEGRDVALDAEIQKFAEEGHGVLFIVDFVGLSAIVDARDGFGEIVDGDVLHSVDADPVEAVPPGLGGEFSGEVEKGCARVVYQQRNASTYFSPIRQRYRPDAGQARPAARWRFAHC